MNIDKRIKILVIVNAIFGYDGISNVAINYYRYQDKTQVKMDLLTINSIPKKLRAEIEADGNKAFVLTERNRNPLKYILTLSKIVAENQYDIFYVHGNSATMAVELFAAKLGNCKVRVAHSHNTQCNHQKINRLLMPIFSRLYTDCCACSSEAGRFLFGNRDCHVVNNGLYLPEYTFNINIRNRIREKCGLKDKIVIGHVGRFSYQKNQEFLVGLLEAVVDRGYDAALLLVGNGKLVEETKQHVKEKNLEKRVVFYGTTDYVNEVVQAMDCFVFPSRFEGLGIAALEAQASGLACVASALVPQQVKVNDNTVFLSLNDNIQKWADAVLARITTVFQREESIDATKKLFEKAGYDIEVNCLDMLAYYRMIINKKEC